MRLKKSLLIPVALAVLSACGGQTASPPSVSAPASISTAASPTFDNVSSAGATGDDATKDDASQAEVSLQVRGRSDQQPTPSDQASASSEPIMDEPIVVQDDGPKGEDVINNIIWEIQSGAAKPPAEPEPTIPEGADPSLAADALEAAFALLAKASQPSIPTADFVLPEKKQNVSRVALLVPLSGPRRALGEELRKGAEMALFTVAKNNIEMLVFDTAAGPKAALAAQQAVEADADIIVGPLFTEAAIPAHKIAKSHGIPMLLLSNNSDIGVKGSWLMGYVPEQQLDVALGHSISLGHEKFAILAQNTLFGQRLKNHAQNRLAQFGITPIEVNTLTTETLNDEGRLKTAMKTFARYTPPTDEDGVVTQIDPPFDSVVFAGDAAFALRTAPVLAYYDVASDKVTYLGNALWDQRQILKEPSLQGGVYAARPTANDPVFNEKWGAIWSQKPGLLARVSFDAMAMVVVLARNEDPDWHNRLISDAGFSGFSGAFRLLPDGGNVRAFELRQINNGGPEILKSAPAKI